MFSSKSERRGAELLPNSGEAFMERLEMLASTVSSTAAALAKTDGEIAGLRRELGGGLARLEELTAELRTRARASDVHELQKTVGSLAHERSGTSETKRLDDLGSKVAMLAERVNTLASTVATTASSVAGRDGEVAALRKQFGQAPQGATVDEALLRRLEDAVSASASASMRLESLGSRIADLESRDDVQQAVSDLEERLDTAERERAALATSVADATAARWHELERALGELTPRLDAAEKRAAETAAGLARVTSVWPAALRSLEARLDELANALRPTHAAEPSRDGPDVLEALLALERRMERANEAAREERGAVLEHLERLTGQLEGRRDLVPVARQIVPFRTES